MNRFYIWLHDIGIFSRGEVPLTKPAPLCPKRRSRFPVVGSLLSISAIALLTSCATTTVGIQSETKYGSFGINYTLPSKTLRDK